MIIDYRENDLIALCPEATTKNLPVGDIWIGTTQDGFPAPGGILIERKTVADLVASILDGRYREQRTRLLAYAQETQTSLLYIIEGFIPTAQRLAPEVVKQWLNRLMLRYRIPVVNTLSITETAATCKLLEKQLQEDPACFKFEAVGYENLVKVQKKTNMEDPKVFFCAALQQCTGVSAAVSTAIWEKTKSWKALLEISQEDLANVHINEKRRIGPKLAERLKALLQ